MYSISLKADEQNKTLMHTNKTSQDKTYVSINVRDLILWTSIGQDSLQSWLIFYK